jgi:hypothetical protein
VRRCSWGRRLALYAARRSSGVGIGGRESMGVPKGVMIDATTWWTAVLTFRRCRLITSPWLRELLGSWTRWLVWSAKYYCKRDQMLAYLCLSLNPRDTSATHHSRVRAKPKDEKRTYLPNPPLPPPPRNPHTNSLIHPARPDHDSHNLMVFLYPQRCSPLAAM